MAKQLSKNQAKYDKEHIIQVTLKLHKINDSDIIHNMDMKNKQGSIKELIRKGLYK